MDDRLARLDWLPELTEQIEKALDELRVQERSCRPAFEQELAQLEASMRGWRQSLGNANLPVALRAELEQEWAQALERKTEIETSLASEAHTATLVKSVAQPGDVLARLERLAEVLAQNDPTAGNLELNLHIDKIICYADGSVQMKTCKLGTMPAAVNLLAEPEVPDSASPGESSPSTRPRRRGAAAHGRSRRRRGRVVGRGSVCCGHGPVCWPGPGMVLARPLCRSGPPAVLGSRERRGRVQAAAGKQALLRGARDRVRRDGADNRRCDSSLSGPSPW